MKFVATPVAPPPAPAREAAQLLGDVKLEAQVFVLVGGLAFRFWRVEGGEDWTGGEATTAAKGHIVDARIMAASKAIAVDVLREAIGEKEPGTDTVRCPRCQRILSSSEMPKGGEIVAINCGPTHEVQFKDGRQLNVSPRGAVWA
jgi:hypothetical protein